MPLLILVLLPFFSALQLDDDSFFSSISNSTVLVDSVTLDQVTVTNMSTEFYNVTSVGSNFTNNNATFLAQIDFYGLVIGHMIENVNTSTLLFTSAIGDTNFNATVAIGEVITLTVTVPVVTATSTLCTGIFGGFGSFMSLIVIVIIISAAGFILYLFVKDADEFDINSIAVSIIVALVTIILGWLIIQAVLTC